MLALCSVCGGFIPSTGDRCPHCDRPSTLRARGAVGKLAGAALGVAASMTLMACYGAPDMDVSGCNTFPLLSSGMRSGDTAEITFAPISCGNADTPTRVFAAYPEEPGTMTLHWTGNASLSVARWTCADRVEIDCQGPSSSGELSFKVYGLQSFAIDGLSDADAASTEFWVELVPSCGDGFQETFEQCDDGAREPGDGCDENCRFEEPQ